MANQKNKDSVSEQTTNKSAQPADAAAAAAPSQEQPSKLDEFAKTGIAAKLSGKFHETAGTVKRKIGEVTGNPELVDEGRKQELLGKVHRLVGAVRGVREGLQGVATKFVADIKNVFKE